MRKIERVAEFVDTFLQQAFAEFEDVRRQTVEFITQTVQGNHRGSSTKLRFSKYKDVEIEVGDRQEPPRIRLVAPGKRRKDFRGRVLLPGDVEGVGGFGDGREEFAGDLEFADQACSEIREELKITLRFQADVANFVEENGAAVGNFEAALFAVLSAGEGALFMAEEFAFEKRLGKRAAVNHP
jgi:hypothetical protein